MNIRKEENDSNRSRFTLNTLFGKISGIHNALSADLPEAHEIEPYLYDENTRKLAEATRLELEVWKAKAYRLLREMV